MRRLDTITSTEQDLVRRVLDFMSDQIINLASVGLIEEVNEDSVLVTYRLHNDLTNYAVIIEKEFLS